jgi:hypothetical protein
MEDDMEAETDIIFKKAFEAIINGIEGKYGFDKDNPEGEAIN